ncbi:glycosyltransferase [uncultured Lacinutrix sp.]|uniref:glycosyltransferase n=1 Tax=uncultured Lacinutrix sp. TaxID=574032 RepID=UPI00260AD3EB|nr:glycosyltransferase [uncultured Lacinutrix sp.]
MFKALKTKFRNNKLRKKLLKNKVLFNIDSFSFSSKNVLIIDQIIPEFNKDSGSRRLTEIIKLLLEKDVSVFLVADLKQYKYNSDYIEKFKALGVNVYEPAIDENGALLTKELFIEKIASKLDIAWLHRPNIFEKYNTQIKKHNPNIKLVFDMVDFHYLRLSREWKDNQDAKTKAEAERYLQIEIDNCKKADSIIVISEDDKVELIKHYNTISKMVVIGNIHDYIPKNETFITPEKRNELLFVGGFKHMPNEDAVLYLYNDIMPLVWEQHPDIKINIVGSYPTETVLALHSEQFNVIGFVEDVAAYYKTAKLFVAPLKYGAGVKGKIGQSFEYSLPVVTTDIGAEGFDFSPYNETMIANNAKDFADSIIALYTNNELWEAASGHSKKIIQPFSLQHISNTIDVVLSK